MAKKNLGRLMVTPKLREKLMEKYDISRGAIYYALAFKSDSQKAQAIRKEALNSSECQLIRL